MSKVLVGSLLAKSFGIASIVLFTRFLTKQELAVFPVFLMLAGLCDLILTLGMFSQFLRELPSLLREDYDRARSLVVTTSALILLGTIVPALAAVLAHREIAIVVFGDPSQGWIVTMMVPGFLAYVISRIADQILWGCGQYSQTAIVQTLEPVVRSVLTIGSYFALGFWGVVAGVVVAQFVMAAISFYFVRKIFLGPLPALYPIRKLVMDSLPYYIGNYLSYLRGDGDSILISLLLGPAALAEYFVAKTIFANVMIVFAAVDRVAVERLARSVNAQFFFDKVTELHEKVAQSMVPFVLLIAAITPSAVIVLAGPRYAGTTWTAVVLLMIALVRFASVATDRTVYVFVPGKVRIWYAVVETVTIFGLALWLAPLLGIIGVAISRVISCAVSTSFGVVMIYRQAKTIISFRTTLVNLVMAAPGTLLALFAMPHGSDTVSAIAWSAAAATVWCVSFAVLSYIFNRPGFEFLLASLLRRIGRPMAVFGASRSSGSGY
ncbi:MAG: oligosaccharide flippase family protein [Proteobacteria bacterium]|nr:oligosaccharide flippase family protein [Pseudomonadota bacterium]